MENIEPKITAPKVKIIKGSEEAKEKMRKVREAKQKKKENKI